MFGIRRLRPKVFSPFCKTQYDTRCASPPIARHSTPSREILLRGSCRSCPREAQNTVQKCVHVQRASTTTHQPEQQTDESRKQRTGCRRGFLSSFAQKL